MAIILVIAVITALGGMVSIFVPVLQMMQIAYPDDVVVEHKKLFAFVVFLAMLSVFPVVLVALLIPSVKENFIKGFYKGLTGER